MLSAAHVLIHPSQFPEQVRRDLIASLRTRRVNHKFHYDSIKQTNQWLALHELYSPSRNDKNCAATYERAFAATVKQIEARAVHLIGLGCGGGRKDTRLLKCLKARGKAVSYTPSDVSVAMTLVANQTAQAIVPRGKIFPFVCDLATAGDFPVVLANLCPPRSARLITFFGMIPNFEPEEILSKLAGLVRRQDWLLFSANLAPGADYAAGVRKIMPQYDNEPMREWLLTFLLDLGVERGDGKLRLGIERDADSLRRIVARFEFTRCRTIRVEDESFTFGRGDRMQLFYSYRYTPKLVRQQLSRYGLGVREQWITRSGEEGVFLCGRSRAGE